MTAGDGMPSLSSLAGVRVMDRNGWKGLQWSSLCRMQLTVRVLTVLFLAIGSTNLALAQLRSGRTQRSLYQHRLQAAEEVAATTASDLDDVGHSIMELSDDEASFDDDSVVKAASYVDTFSEPIVEQFTDVVPASCDCAECTSQTRSVGCGAAGCDARGCDVCCGGYSSIAPTSTVACPPGCGPLMALWYRLKVRAEVPLYWRRDQGPPALVTTAAAGTTADLAGELGQSTTSILLGDRVLSDDSEAGLRLTFGTWLGGGQRYGLMLRYWNAGDQDDTFNFTSNEFEILARPFQNTTVAGSPEQDTQLVAFPGESIGNIAVGVSSSVEGVNFSLRRLLYMDRFTRVDWVYGYQHVSIDELLTISSQTTVTGTVPGLQGNMIAISDRFETENDFNGVSYGLMSTRRFACWRMETMFRLGAGNLRRQVRIAGSTTTTSGGNSVTSGQGLLARNTNNQPFIDDTFVVIPEVGINFAYRFRPGCDFTVGYNYMMVPKVAQAAQQIDNDLSVNLSDPLVGALDPQLDFSERSYWLNSLGLGFQLRY